jgi:uracil phosphoribosyltransferase
MNRIVLKAHDLDGYLTQADKNNLDNLDSLYQDCLSDYSRLCQQGKDPQQHKSEEQSIIKRYNEMGTILKGICKAEPNLYVYPFSTHDENHAEASRLIAKLRDVRTGQEEFVYYTQRAYELLFNLAYGQAVSTNKNYLIVKTPVGIPVQQFAVHKIPNIDDRINQTVMCVMLRGALLPSIIMSKEIEEYSSTDYATPFALFKIKRDDTKKESNMEYVLDLDRSYFNLEELDGKDLIFADPMNATGGSLVTVIKYLQENGVKPRSVKCFNIITALKGALRCVRAVPGLEVYTLWMDPVMNDLAYILPGLGDAGDRINGKDTEEHPRDIIQLIADYGRNIANLYRGQIRKIEETVLRH